jgi:DNA-binding LacI/PurR family transcriptional regulator
MSEEDRRLKPVKIIDLAARIGMDKATVSRALNNRSGVAPKTRERIVSMALEMGYTPNIHGQQLRGWKSTTLALVMGANVNSLPPSFYVGPYVMEIYRAAAERGHDLLILSCQGHAEESIADALVRRGGVGCVLLGWQPEEVLESMRLSSMPCVQLDSYEKRFTTVDFVISDNEQGSLEITRHLIGLGHRRISFVGDFRPFLGSSVTRMERLSPFGECYAGFLQALDGAGLSEVTAGAKVGDTKPYVRRLFKSPDPPTAIVAATDTCAADVAEAAQEMGLVIPRDLSLTGFDDVAPALFNSLNLTTVRINQPMLADTAVDILLTHDPSSSKRIGRRIPTKMIVRGSTGPPPTVQAGV